MSSWLLQLTMTTVVSNKINAYVALQRRIFLHPSTTAAAAAAQHMLTANSLRNVVITVIDSPPASRCCGVVA